MVKHKHAELMLQYAQDAMESSEPWERWEEYVLAIERWVTMSSNPDWNTRIEYRRKPKMISVTLESGEVVSWPAPHRTELEYGDAYYFVDVDGSATVEGWDCLEWDERALADGWIHLTEEAAQQHAAALRKINTQGA